VSAISPRSCKTGHGPTPDGHDSCVDLVDKVELKLAGAGKVFDPIETKSTDPILANLAGRSSMSLESLEDRDRILVRNRQATVNHWPRLPTYEGMVGWLVPSDLVAFL
jgi:hypothetical protein